jgi:hypothetical protein
MLFVADIHIEGKPCPCCGETKPAADFAVRKTGRPGHLVAHCKACNLQKQKVRKRRDPTIYERVERRSKLKRQYNLSLEEYDAMFEAQGFACAICKTTTPGARTKHFHVDHCHTTGVVRGLLCHKCNRGIGLFDDNPDRVSQALAYLTKGD